MTTHLLLLISALCWSCEGAGPDKISAEELRNVHKAARLDKQWGELFRVSRGHFLDFRVSFRCGLFFPDPKNAGAVPVAPLFIFNNSWSADECPAGNKARYNKFCDSIVGPSLAPPSHSARSYFPPRWSHCQRDWSSVIQACTPRMLRKDFPLEMIFVGELEQRQENNI